MLPMRGISCRMLRRVVGSCAVLLVVSCAENVSSIYGPARSTSSIMVKEPQTGSQLKVGDTVHIRWTCDSLDISDVDILLTVDGGKKWLLLNEESSVTISNPQWLDFVWIIPATNTYPSWLPDAPAPVQIAGKKAQIKIRDYEEIEMYGLSGEFQIAAQ